MSKPIGMVISDKSISMLLNNKPTVIQSDNLNFETIKNILLVTKEYDQLESLINGNTNLLIKAFSKQISSNLTITENEEILHDGESIPSTLQYKLLNDIKTGYDITGFALFVENLMQNPSATAIEELYLFIQSGEFPITDDGHFLAYKKVTGDYRDIYSGKFDNSVGQVLKMPRNKVDDKRDNTCSYGFHFCSYPYLAHFGGSRVVILKINPKDVVSIPSDYNNTKGRTCRYEVIGEVENWQDDDIFKNYSEHRSFYEENEDELENDENESYDQEYDTHKI
jgi:hypothetical protein